MQEQLISKRFFLSFICSRIVRPFSSQTYNYLQCDVMWSEMSRTSWVIKHFIAFLLSNINVHYMFEMWLKWSNSYRYNVKRRKKHTHSRNQNHFWQTTKLFHLPRVNLHLPAFTLNMQTHTHTHKRHVLPTLIRSKQIYIIFRCNCSSKH